MYARNGANWRFRHETHGEFSQALPTRLNVNNAEALAPALRAGNGLALQPEFRPGKTCNRACWKRPWMTGGSIRSRCISSRRQGDGVRPVQALIEYLAERLTAQPWAGDVQG